MADDDPRLASIEAGYTSFSSRVRRILVVLAVAQLSLGILSVHLLNQNGNRAHENTALIEQIQQERYYGVKFNCNDVNMRNAATKNQLDEFAPPPAGPEATEQAEQRIAATKLLIDRLLPVRDCDELAAHLVGNGTSRER